jgi:hypothetical protein
MMTWYEAESLEDWRERNSRVRRWLRNRFGFKNDDQTAAATTAPGSRVGIASDA